jgi:transposase
MSVIGMSVLNATHVDVINHSNQAANKKFKRILAALVPLNLALIRTVKIKSIEQQDMQSILHMRRLLSVERTRLINHIRGLLSEYGIVVAQRAATVRKEVPRILEDAENKLTDVFRRFLNRQYLRLIDIENELNEYRDYIETTVKSNDTCKRLTTMPGVGSIVSISLTSWMGDGRQFKRGRNASAALGLIPRQDI